MTAENDRCRRVERELADRGIHASVQSVGDEGTIALVRPDDGAIGSLLVGGREEIVDVCRGAGFRDAAVELFWE